MVGRVGQRFGDYRLIRFLGEGTFGDVYLGERVYDQTPAAIKIFKAKLTPDKFKDFLNEVRTVLLRHPNIVQVLDFGMGEDDVPFLVMEYAPNGTVLQHHPRGTHLPLSLVVSYVKQIAAALQYAHDQRRIHRDVKPENILFGVQNQLLLSDFGIAAVAHGSHSQRTEEAIGTALYMAPEQWQGKPLPATDQYALGVIVYEWLSGRCPFEGGTLQLMYQHLHVPPPPIRAEVPALSPDVEQVVVKALAKQPQERFSRVADFAAALQGIRTTIAPTQTAIYPPTSPTQTPIPPTTPAWPVRRDAGLAASEVPFTTPLITQPGQTFLPPSSFPSTEAAPLASLNPQTLAPASIYPKEVSEKRRMSRRAVIISGLALVGTVTVGGVVVGNAFQHQTSSSQIGKLLYTYRDHYGIFSVAWSPDGKQIASGNSDNTVQVWNPDTGAPIYTFGSPSNIEAVYTVAWSPDGQRIASGSSDHTVQVRDATTNALIYTYTGHSNSVFALSWSPDGKRIVSASGGGNIQVWDATSGALTSNYDYNVSIRGVICTAAWSPNSQLIASGNRGDNTVQVWDATTARNIYTYTGHHGDICAVAWSPDGKRVVSGSGDNTVQVWDATTGANAYTYTGHSNAIFSVAWSPDGKRIISGDINNTVQVWDATNGGNSYTYTGHSRPIEMVAWSPDGKRIASGSDDATVQVWISGS